MITLKTLQVLPHAGADLRGWTRPKLGLKLRLLLVVLQLALSDVPEVLIHSFRELYQFYTGQNTIYVRSLDSRF